MKKTVESGQSVVKKKIFEEALHYFRNKPDVFIEDVLGIKLNLYQKIMVRAFFKYDYIIFVMCRGLGKTFTSMLCLVAYCLLYPYQKCGIIAPSFRQGKLLIQEKYKDELCRMSPFLQGEEKLFICNTQKARVEFHNGSFIEALIVAPLYSNIY